MPIRFGSSLAFIRKIHRMRRTYKSDNEGATAIEFAIVSLPFLGLIFGILELALIFFTSAVLTQSMNDTGRLVRVGAFQGCGSAAEFKALVCDEMSNLMDCQSNLRIDLVTAGTFQSITLEDPGMSGIDPDDDTSEIEEGQFDNTTSGDPVVMRSTFYYPLALPNFMTRLESIPGTRRHVIQTSTAFRNEPFPGGSSCSSSLSDLIDGLLD